LRTYLYNFLFAKTADHLSPGQLFVTTSNSECPSAALSLSLLSTRLGLAPSTDFLTAPKQCARDLRTPLYLKYAESLAENKDAFFCFCEQGRPCSGQCTAMKPSEVRQRVDDGQVYQIKLSKNEKVVGNWKDIVQGEVKMGTGVQEIVLIKRDQRATRALADTVDDHEIKVSHAIRN
jgi:hypothetical protein